MADCYNNMICQSIKIHLRHFRTANGYISRALLGKHCCLPFQREITLGEKNLIPWYTKPCFGIRWILNPSSSLTFKWLFFILTFTTQWQISIQRKATKTSEKTRIRVLLKY